jgi:betaine lipid synthase
MFCSPPPLRPTNLLPCLRCSAYQFWRANASAFASAFYMRGYSGHALRLAKWAFFLGGVRDWVARFVDAPTVDEQARIWEEHLRPVLLAPWVYRLFLSNP